MDDFKPELLKALLEWVNTFELPGRVNSWSQLEDGHILWQILADIDADYFNESLPNFDDNANRRASDNWVPRWQNLKHIERAVSKYIREECGFLPVLTKRMIPDLKTGGRDGSTMLTAKLTMAVLLAACYSQKSNQRMLEIMRHLPADTRDVIITAVQEMQDLDKRMAALGVDQELTPDLPPAGHRTPSRAVSMERDAGLEQEAQLFEANKERKQLKTQVEKLRAELEESEEKYAALEEQLIEARLHLDDHGAQKTATAETEELKAEVARERQYIAELEADLAATKDQLENVERQFERLKVDDVSKQDLRDQLQLIKAERNELNQKVKANENLKKKIQSMSHELKTLETLRQEYQLSRERIQELEPLEDRVEALEKANKENVQTIVQCETSIFEEKGKRTRVEHDNHMLAKQLEQARELQARSDEARKELEERLRELEVSSHGARGNSLEDELGLDDSEATLTLDDSKPTEAQVTSETILLKQKLDIMEARVNSLEAECLKQMNENLGLRSDLMTENDDQSTRPFLEQNQKLQATEAELQEIQQKLREKEVETEALRNELNKRPENGEGVAAEEIQAQNDALVEKARQLTNAMRDLESKSQEQADLLRAALLNRDDLPPGLKDLRHAETLKRIRQQIERVAETKADERPRIIDATSNTITDEIAANQAALEKAKKELLDQRSLNEQLKLDLERAREEGSKKGSEELESEVQNLKHELRLMTTAWYDIVGRLQSNTVALQRRNEVPKSFIQRQRVLVGGNGRAGQMNR